MQYRYLGKTGLQVSVLSFGSWLTFGKQIEDDASERLMATAYAHGVNFFDNAEIYARGQSEVVMGKILKKMNWERSSWLVSSKIFFGDGGKKPNQTGLSRKHLVEGCHAALRRLQVDYLDLLFCHRPDPNTPVGEVVWTMNQLIAQGKVLYWGTSEWSAAEIQAAHDFSEKYRLIGPAMEQPQYNLFHRDRVEVEYAPLYDTVGLGTTIWSPLASGVLTDKYIKQFPAGTRLSMEGLEWLREAQLTQERLDKTRALNALANEMGTSLAKLAIAWCVQNPRVTTAILGASKVDQLEETLTALDLLPNLTTEINDRIDHILR